MKYEIGMISNTHGVKGEVVIKLTTDFDRFIKGKSIYILNPDKKEFIIKSVKAMNKGLVVSFEGITNINEVISYKGQVLYSDEKPILEEDEYHYRDLLNKEVYNEKGILIGTVIEVLEMPQGHLLRVKMSDKTGLIPFRKEFVLSVEDVITIREIEGLL